MVLTLFFLLSVLELLSIFVSGATTPFPVVNLGYATYKGLYSSSLNLSSFLGIRYAAPPIPRWFAPREPAQQPNGLVLNATLYPTQCYQANIGQSTQNNYRQLAVAATRTNVGRKRDASVKSGEDCLFLNVFTPGLPQNQSLLPVIVFIHGGAWVSGAANAWPSMADMVLESYSRVVTVQMQYRLGAFGWLSGQHVKDAGVLNAGLLDQEFALKWIQKHITKFGGNPAQVTIWGESAGAGSVLQHVVARGGQTNPPLFQQSMTSSIVLPGQYNYNDIFPESIFSSMVHYTGCSGAAMPVKCMRGVSSDVLQNANNLVVDAGFYRTSVFVPVIDGNFIIERPSKTLLRGTVNGKSTFVVSNIHEGLNFALPNSTTANFVAQLLPFLKSDEIQQVVNEYTGLYASEDETNQAIVGEYTFICPSYFFANAFNGVGYRAIFEINPGSHGTDLGSEFGRLTTPAAVAAYKSDPFRSAFAQAFASMSIFKTPNMKIENTTITPPWGPWSFSTPTEMLFGQNADGSPSIRTNVTDPALNARCIFWNRLTADTWQ